MDQKIRIHWLTEFTSRPLTWIVLSAVLVAGDFYGGEAIQFPIAYVLPVLFMAWHLRKWWAIAFSLGLPLQRFLIVKAWSGALPHPKYLLLNLVIRIVVLLILATFVWRYRSAEKELKILRGVLPVCMHCKKIRSEDQRWQQLESYIAAHSEADFSHGLCPECAKQYYPEVFGKIADRPEPGVVASPRRP